eukprot:TRINITY_DN81885_c0_g1_i1.p1 TRINITY_DN81885_c0_g1~~TRINITY_DN81885_c0_g1_i1.p1  ORF type:complete len:365 (-),score=56.48 TRINITY_DN81885_c0_g1_i1:71-1165(-)
MAQASLTPTEDSSDNELAVAEALRSATDSLCHWRKKTACARAEALGVCPSEVARCRASAEWLDAFYWITSYERRPDIGTRSIDSRLFSFEAEIERAERAELDSNTINRARTIMQKAQRTAHSALLDLMTQAEHHVDADSKIVKIDTIRRVIRAEEECKNVTGDIPEKARQELFARIEIRLGFLQKTAIAAESEYSAAYACISQAISFAGLAASVTAPEATMHLLEAITQRAKRLRDIRAAAEMDHTEKIAQEAENAITKFVENVRQQVACGQADRLPVHDIELANSLGVVNGEEVLEMRKAAKKLINVMKKGKTRNVIEDASFKAKALGVSEVLVNKGLTRARQLPCCDDAGNQRNRSRSPRRG